MSTNNKVRKINTVVGLATGCDGDVAIPWFSALLQPHQWMRCVGPLLLHRKVSPYLRRLCSGTRMEISRGFSPIRSVLRTSGRLRSSCWRVCAVRCRESLSVSPYREINNTCSRLWGRVMEGSSAFFWKVGYAFNLNLYNRRTTRQCRNRTPFFTVMRPIPSQAREITSSTPRTLRRASSTRSRMLCSISAGAAPG